MILPPNSAENSIKFAFVFIGNKYSASINLLKSLK